MEADVKCHHCGNAIRGEPHEGQWCNGTCKNADEKSASDLGALEIWGGVATCRQIRELHAGGDTVAEIADQLRMPESMIREALGDRLPAWAERTGIVQNFPPEIKTPYDRVPVGEAYEPVETREIEDFITRHGSFSSPIW